MDADLDQPLGDPLPIVLRIPRVAAGGATKRRRAGRSSEASRSLAGVAAAMCAAIIALGWNLTRPTHPREIALPSEVPVHGEEGPIAPESIPKARLRSIAAADDAPIEPDREWSVETPRSIASITEVSTLTVGDRR